MKSILLLILSVLFAAMFQSARGQVTLRPNIDTVTLKAGDSAVFTINFTIPNGFDASIFLNVSVGNNAGVQALLSSLIANVPYSGVKMTVKTNRAFTKSGLYGISINGNYGQMSTSTLCYIRVISDSTTWRIFPLGYSMPGFVTQDSEGNYWHDKLTIEGNTQGLFKQIKSTPIEQWIPPNANNTSGGGINIPPVIDNKSGKVWQATKNEGVLRYSFDFNNKTVFDMSSSPLPSNSIMDIVIDTKDNIWIATDKGLVRLSGMIWTIFNSTNSVLNNEPITCLRVYDSIVWIGTTNGLVRYNGHDWQRITPQNSTMPASYVWRMAVESNGDVWMGLSADTSHLFWYGGPNSMIGIAHYNGTDWKLFNNQNSPLGTYNYISSISIDKKGNKWFSTASQFDKYNASRGGAGILKYNNVDWTAYTPTNSPLPDTNVNWVGLDINDNVWFRQFYVGAKSASQIFWGVFNENGLPPFLAPPTSVEEQPEATDGITIFPNPTNTSFTIRGIDNILSIKLMNSLGIEVSRKPIVVSGKVEVDVADLASGIYFVQMRTPTGMITKSIVVSR